MSRGGCLHCGHLALAHGGAQARCRVAGCVCPGYGRARRRRPEHDRVQVPCRRLLALHGYHVYHLAYPAPTHHTPGLPDDLALAPGRLLALEYKGPGGRLTPAQAAFGAAWRAAGGIYLVIHDPDELAAHLAALATQEAPDAPR